MKDGDVVVFDDELLLLAEESLKCLLPFNKIIAIFITIIQYIGLFDFIETPQSLLTTLFDAQTIIFDELK